MNQHRVVLVTGGMGGLGETISTKMVDAGYRLAVTYSPGNKTHAEWVAQMKARGYDILAVPCDVADYESCGRAVAEVRQKLPHAWLLFLVPFPGAVHVHTSPQPQKIQPIVTQITCSHHI